MSDLSATNQGLSRAPSELRTRSKAYLDHAATTSGLLRDFEDAVQGAIAAAGEDEAGLQFSREFRNQTARTADKIRQLESLLAELDPDCREVARRTEIADLAPQWARTDLA